MNTNMKIFQKDDKSGLILYYDMVFIEAARPLFFTCVDEKENLYVCSCHCADGEKCEWIVVSTTADRVIKVLADEITIREIFESGVEGAYLITLRANSKAPEIQCVRMDEIPGDILPTAGYYMEPDEGEFDFEIAELRARAQNACTLDNMSRSYFTTSQNFSIKMTIPAFDWLLNAIKDTGTKHFSIPFVMGGQVQ